MRSNLDAATRWHNVTSILEVNLVVTAAAAVGATRLPPVAPHQAGRAVALVGEDLAVEKPQLTAHGDVLGYFPFTESRIRR